MVQKETIADNSLHPFIGARELFFLLLKERDFVSHSLNFSNMFFGFRPGAGDKKVHSFDPTFLTTI